MANTFELIASSTVGSGGAANITFSSIPSTFTDLIVKVSARDVFGVVAENVQIQFNGSSSSLSSRILQGDGSSASSYTDPLIYGRSSGDATTANTFNNMEFYIPNYAGSTNKSVSVDSVAENNATTSYMTLTAGLWSNTAAITSIQISPTRAVNFMQYTTAYLYGVKNA